MELERVFVLADTHFPSHEHGNYQLVLKCIRKWKPTMIVHLGDMVDNYAVSTFAKAAFKPQTLVEEFAPAMRCIRQLEQAAPDAKLILCEGNHEERLERWLHETKALWGMVSLKELLRLHRWKIVPTNERWKVGKLYSTHGTRSTKYATSAMLDRYASSVFFGHTHRPAMSFKSTIGGEHVAVCPGWLGDIRDEAFSYAPDPDWAAGFATVLVEKSTGNFHWSLNLIVNGRVRLDGEIVE